MPFTITQQTMIDGSVTGGPVLPTPTHPLIKDRLCTFKSCRCIFMQF